MEVAHIWEISVLLGKSDYMWGMEQIENAMSPRVLFKVKELFGMIKEYDTGWILVKSS